MPKLGEKILCSVCETLFQGSATTDIKDVTFVPHHTSFTSFDTALKKNCRICTSIWEQLSEECRQHLREQEGDYQISRYHSLFGRAHPLDDYACHRILIDVCPEWKDEPHTEGRRFDFALELAESRHSTQSSNPGS
jgi:hypothetical protein